MDNNVIVKISLQGVDRFKADADKALGSLSKNAQITGGKMSAFGKVGGIALRGVANAAIAMATVAATAFVAISKKGIQTAANFETIEAGFITLLGSAEDARKAIELIKKDALKTPFDPTQLARLNQMLTGITKNATLSNKILLDVGEALVAMGRGTEEMDRIIVNLQQIGATGRASMLDIRQFAFAGIPIFQMLTKETGLSGEALDKFVSDGKVSFDLLVKMFDEANNAGGQFFNGYANNAGTFNQLTAELQEKWSNFTEKFVKDTGIFQASKDIIASFGLVLGQLGQSLPQLVENFRASDFVAYLQAQFELGKAFINGFKDSFMNIWNVMQPAVQDFMNTLNKTFGLGADKTNSMKISIEALGKAAGVIFAAIVISIMSVSSAILKVNNVILSVSTAFSNLKNKITSVFSGIGSSISSALKSPINTGIDYANNLIKGYNRLPLPDLPYIPKFANGGIVGGSSLSGDRVMARVNSGEMILNRSQQTALFNMLKGFSSRPNINFNGGVNFGSNASPMQQEYNFINMLRNI